MSVLWAGTMVEVWCTSRVTRFSVCEPTPILATSDADGYAVVTIADAVASGGDAADAIVSASPPAGDAGACPVDPWLSGITGYGTSFVSNCHGFAAVTSMALTGQTRLKRTK